MLRREPGLHVADVPIREASIGVDGTGEELHPSGQHGTKPMPHASQNGSMDSSGPRHSIEYSLRTVDGLRGVSAVARGLPGFPG